MRIAVVTLFPEMLAAVTGSGVTRRAVERGLLAVEAHNPRDHARDVHRTVDDRPFGGGPGMVMKVEPLRDATVAACNAVESATGKPPRVICLSPQGAVLTQARAEALAAEEGGLVLVAGRYEGIDERFIEAYVDEELSIGDYVLSGGELAAMVVIDAVTRLLPGVLGDEDSAKQDSFSGEFTGLLDCPHYTRPELFEGRAVPAVLTGGNHAAIRRWRLMQALGRTRQRRPDLFAQRVARGLGKEELKLLDEYRVAQEQRDGRA
ncbi:MAG: tRNA (guanosine(37)-N1)-methyltransferase TrmD [Diaphorobacter sp.]|nr:tRNA (guanosine(37)-N1)-methyltransferase TrmD [Diaphorobacter sp.]